MKLQTTKEFLRFNRKVLVNPKTGCWEWTGRKDKDGYGHFQLRRQNCRVHRVSYETWIGPIPEGLTIDHLCNNPACIREHHLRVCSNKENILRGTGPTAVNSRKAHCIRGHALEGKNLIILRKGRRECRACTYGRTKRYYHKRKAQKVRDANCNA